MNKMPGPFFRVVEGKVHQLDVVLRRATLYLDTNDYFVLWHYQSDEAVDAEKRIVDSMWLSMVETAVASDKTLTITSLIDSSLAFSVQLNGY